jgi:hypothetical protein
MAVKRVPKEFVIERELVRQVEAAGGLCLKVQTIGRRGFFDRLIVLPGGEIIFAEVKRPASPSRSKQTTHQIWYATKFIALGATVAVVRTLGDIAALLKQGRDDVQPSRPLK